MEMDKEKQAREMTGQYLFYERLIAQLETATKVTGYVGNIEFVIPRTLVPDMIRIFAQSQATLARQIDDL